MVLSSSSQTELKACLSSKSLCVFLLQMETSRWNWTRTVRGQLNEGGKAAAGTWDAAPRLLEPSGEVAAGRGVNVAVWGALQLPIRPGEIGLARQVAKVRAVTVLHALVQVAVSTVCPVTADAVVTRIVVPIVTLLPGL